MEDKKTYWGWSNEATMFAWGAVNPLGVLISKKKPSLTFKSKKKDEEELRKFFSDKEYDNMRDDINYDELLNYIYR